MVGNRRAESVGHSLLKFIIASILERQGHKVHLEVECPDGSIIDVFDETDGIAYEIQTNKQYMIEKKKTEKYLKWALVNDVIFIYTKNYPVNRITNSKSYKKLRFKIIGE